MSLRISASALKLFKECPRAWYRQHVLKIQREQKSYLTKGDDFDLAVQARVRGVAHAPATALVQAQLTKVDARLPPRGRAEAQFAYLVSAGDGVLVTGKPDVRWRDAAPPGVLHIQDTKTTSDRDENVGAGEDRPPYALTDGRTPGGDVRPLREDYQARLYAWCEFTLADAGAAPPIASVQAEWLYVTKAKSPKSWSVRAAFERAETYAWFESEVRPMAERMRELIASGLPELGVNANPDACRRCLVSAGCSPFEGANVYGVSGPQKRDTNMVFDIKKLRANHGVATVSATPDGRMVTFVEPTYTLENQLAASLVAINRPALAVAPPPEADVLEVTTIEGLPEAFGEIEHVTDAPKAQASTLTSVSVDTVTTAEPSVASAPDAPRRRRRTKAEMQAARSTDTPDPDAAVLAEIRANLEQALELLARVGS